MMPLFTMCVLFFAMFFPVVTNNYYMAILLISYIIELFTWIAVIDPIITIITVKNYRRYVFGFIRSKTSNTTSIKTTSINTTSSNTNK